MEYKNLLKSIDIIAQLRNPVGGCPWDLEQDHKSLLKFLIEESYEYIEAVEEGTNEMMEEELGDVLLQILLHCQIASEEKNFDIDSIAKVLNEKLVYRHPHVFENPEMELNSSEVLVNWKKLKNGKKAPRPYHIMREDAFAPALQASAKIGKKSQAVNFDWDRIEDVLAKVEEELQEVKEEMLQKNNHKKTQEEIGDLLFSVAQLARHLDINPEQALKEANLKFITRVNLVEDQVKSQNKKMVDLSTNQLEEIWQEVKKKEKT